MFSLFILQILICGILARTNQDVLDEFKPVFDNVHNEFTKLEESSEAQVVPLLKAMEEVIKNQTVNVQNEIKQAKDMMEKIVEQTLKEADLQGKPELTAPCMSKLNLNLKELEAKTNGGERICTGLASIQFNSSENFANTLLTQLHNEHNIVDIVGKEECVKYGTPFEVQECLINDIYLYYKTYLVDCTEEVKYRIKKLQADRETLETDLNTCDKVLEDNLQDDFDKVIDNFKQCIKEIKL